jgi:hypothetical protein
MKKKAKSEAAYVGVETQPQRTFNVVIAYESFPTGIRAKAVFDRLVERFVSYCAFSSSMWKFDFLRLPKLRDVAANEAAEADMILFAVQRENEFPPAVKDWIDIWLPRIGDCLLVGLLETDGTGRCRANPAFLHLKKVAEEGNLKFLCLEHDKPLNVWMEQTVREQGSLSK